MIACKEGHHDVAVMLISKGADINHVDEVSDTSWFIVQIKCVVTESLTFTSHVHVCIHVVVNRHVQYIIHTYVQYVVDLICITVAEWIHPITVSLLEWSPWCSSNVDQ